VWWFSPHCVFICVVLDLWFCCRGDYTGERRYLYSRSPLCTFLLLFVLILACWSRCRGDSQGRRYLYSRSPLSELEFLYFFTVVCFDNMSGRFTGERSILSTLVLPSMKPELSIFKHHDLTPIFDHFFGASFLPWSIGCGVVYTVARATICYIYSLGHFLTTKGALIDGDWGGVKNHPFSPKVIKKEW